MTLLGAARHGWAAIRDWVRDIAADLLAALGELYR